MFNIVHESYTLNRYIENNYREQSERRATNQRLADGFLFTDYKFPVVKGVLSGAAGSFYRQHEPTLATTETDQLRLKGKSPNMLYKNPADIPHKEHASQQRLL